MVIKYYQMVEFEKELDANVLKKIELFQLVSISLICAVAALLGWHRNGL